MGCLAEEIKEKYNTEEEDYRVRELFLPRLISTDSMLMQKIWNSPMKCNVHSETSVKIISEDKRFQT